MALLFITLGNGHTLEQETPIEKLRELGFDLPNEFTAFPVILLDEVAVTWASNRDHHLLHKLKKCRRRKDGSPSLTHRGSAPTASFPLRVPGWLIDGSARQLCKCPRENSEGGNDGSCRGTQPTNRRGASGSGRRSLAGRPTVGHPCSPWNGE